MQLKAQNLSSTEIHPLPYNTINSTYFIDNKVGFSVGYYGEIRKTTDAGENWHMINQGTEEHLYSVFFSSKTKGFIGGTNGNVLITNDGGETWMTMIIGQYVGDVTSLFFTDSITGFALSGQNIFKTENGGVNWQPQISGTDYGLTSVFFIDKNKGFIGVTNGSILITNNGGDSWVEQKIDANQNSIRQVHFPTDSIGYLLVSSGVYRTNDKGLNWEYFNFNQSCSANSLFFTDSITGHVGGTSFGSGVFLHTSDGGKTWVKFEPFPNISNSTINSIYFSDYNNGYGVGQGGTIYKTNNGGNNWNLLNTDINFKQIVFTSKDTGYVAVGGGGIVLRTIDNGRIWTKCTTGLAYSYSIAFINNNTGLCIGENGKIVRTKDGGKTWDSIQCTANHLTSVCFPSKNWGYAVGLGGTIIKIGESSNKCTPLVSGTSANLLSVYFINEVSGWAIGASGTILTTSDGGTNWTPQSSGINSQLNKVYFFDKNIGYILGSGVVLKTINGGKNWERLYNWPLNIESVFFTKENIGYAVGYSYLYKTTDGGASWNSYLIAGDTEFYSLYFINDTMGFAAGEETIVRIIDNSINTSFVDTQIENSLPLYPNPCEGNLYFPGNESPINIELFNSNGILIKKAIITNQLDVSDLSSGVYYLKVFKKGSIQTHSIIKI